MPEIRSLRSRRRRWTRSKCRRTTPPWTNSRVSPSVSTSRGASTSRRTTRTPAPAATRKRTDGSPTSVLSPAEAEALIGQHLQCLPIESMPLAQCAGAVLRENIYAERDAPPFDRVAMDGIALLSEAARGGTRRFRIQATQAAGDPPLTLNAKSGCIEVMTGAIMPNECDAVVPVEQITTRGDEVELA